MQLQANHDTVIRKINTMNNNKPIPVLYERKEDCCGCTACYAICPKSAIEMKEDEEGFEYPSIVEAPSRALTSL